MFCIHFIFIVTRLAGLYFVLVGYDTADIFDMVLGLFMYYVSVEGHKLFRCKND